MKTLFIYSRIEKEIEASGEAKKIRMQMTALSEHGIECDIMYHNRYVPNNKILIRIPLYPIYGQKFKRKLVEKLREGYDAIYFRKYIFDSSFLNVLRELKKEFPNLKILVEIPTYPYDLEWSSLIDKPILTKEKIHRKKLFKYVDRFITFSDDDVIFNVPCIRTSNGIDCSKVSVRKPHTSFDETIHLLGVACIEKWHGFDRIIKGLYDYYQNAQNKRKIVFDIVGDGAEVPKLKKLSESCDLNDYVFFHGSKHGKELNQMFDTCDVGIGSLGMYRIGLMNGYTLKLREYTVRGIPFIYAYNDSLIESDNLPYKLKFPNDNSAISIDKIVEFYDQMAAMDFNVVALEMTDYAKKYLTWTKQMQPVAEYIKLNLGEKEND